MSPTWRMTREIEEQPDLFEGLVDDWMTRVDELQKQIESRSQLVLVGRGSSKNASVYTSYIYALATGRHAIEFRPWMTVRDTPRQDWSNATVFAYSSSGQSTDIAHAAHWLAERGAYVLGITNATDANCRLGQSSNALFQMGLGDELAVPATKSFNAQLLVSAALLGFDLPDALPEITASMRTLLDGHATHRLANLLEGARTTAWIARGPAMGVARDAALKCRECARYDATGWSAAEIQHGHIASFDHRDRVVIFSDANEPVGSFSSVSKTLLNQGTPFAVIGLDYYRHNGGAPAPVIPIDLPDQLWARAPVFAFLSQQTALELANRLDLNPDAPAGLSKVTETI